MLLYNKNDAFESVINGPNIENKQKMNIQLVCMNNVRILAKAYGYDVILFKTIESIFCTTKSIVKCYL